MESAFFAGTIIILLFSVIIHEVMHGVAALMFGDQTAQRAGRLTLNPIPHIDPIGTILLPLLLIISGSPVLFGWAKPVPVNPLNFRDYKKGELFTSAAGVLTNLGIAILAAVIFQLVSPPFTSLLNPLLRFTVNINLILAIFNLLPIPPLDGSKIVMSFLPPRLEIEYRKLEKYGFIILLLLLFIPFEGGTLLGTILGFFLNILHSILGV